MATEAAPSEVVRVRAAKESDAAFVIASWLQSYRSGSPAKHMPKPLYFEAQQAKIKRLLERSMVWVVCLTSEPDEIVGYAVVEQSVGVAVVHWLYVKEKLRAFGVGTLLMRMAKEAGPNGIQYTHKPKPTKANTRLVSRFAAVFNPSLGE